MKIPTSWNDPSILEEEPFASAFRVFKDQGKNVRGVSNILDNIVKSLQETPSISDTVNAWVSLVCIPILPQETKTTLSLTKSASRKDLRIFALAYSYLARENELSALSELNIVRRGHGFCHIEVERLRTALASAATKRKKKTKGLSDGQSVRVYPLRGRALHADAAPLEKPIRKEDRRLEIPKRRPSSQHEIPKTDSPTNNKRKGSFEEPTDRLRKRQKVPRSKPAPPKKGKKIGNEPTSSRSNPPIIKQALDGGEVVSRSLSKLKFKKNRPQEAVEEELAAFRNPVNLSPPIETSPQHPEPSIETQPTQGCDNELIPSQMAAPGPLIGRVDEENIIEDGECFGNSAIPEIQQKTIEESTKSMAVIFDGTSVSAELLNELGHNAETSLENAQTQSKEIHLVNSQPILESNVPVADPANVSPVAPKKGKPQKARKDRKIPHADESEIVKNVPFNVKLELLESLPSVNGANSLRQSDILAQEIERSSLPVASIEVFQPVSPPLHVQPETLPEMTSKEPLPSLPPIWAQSRQEVCESFDWFRSYQGGVYHSNEIVKGYLLSGFPSSRDRFEHGGRLIISHGGGKAESLHSAKGQISSHPASDQLAHDKSVRALLNNFKHGRPLALLIDDKYALFPFDLGSKDVAYAVLGFYTVVHAWAEYQQANTESGYVVRYKFAFRWCEDQGSPWWIHKEAPVIQMATATPMAVDNPPPPQVMDTSDDSTLMPHMSDQTPSCGLSQIASVLQGENDASKEAICQICNNASPRVFRLQWTCLTPECRMFWRQTEGLHVGHYISGDLSYHPQFLKLPVHKALPFGFQDVVRSLAKNDMEVGTLRSYQYTRGFHCPECGRLSSRSQWETWECLHCAKSLKLSIPTQLANDIWNQILPISFRDYLLNPLSDFVPSSPSTFVHDAGRGIINSFTLPDFKGKIHHIQPGNARGRKEADRIFLDYQSQAASGDLKFRRWPLRAHKCRGSLLTNYFSHNAGEPYKYVGGDANTVPFDSAPSAVRDARSLIEKRVKQALGIPVAFNEVLSAAYMERQKMAFHSDNEVGLGPVVAGLSLGSPALMHFRLHPKFDPDRQKKGILLTIVLRHGDVLVMDGEGIQECYEHTVVPSNFRIAATARQIGKNHS